MPYFTVTDFAAGLDLRRSSLTAPEGTLRSLINCHITPGGEIEKRNAFVKIADVDPTSRSLVEVQGGMYVFMPGGPSQVDPDPNSWDVGQMLLATSTLEDVIDFDLFDNQVFVVAQLDAIGTVERFYNNAAVPAATGFFCRTYKTKMFAVAGSVMSFSAVGNPADWTGTGSGSIDLSLEDADMTECMSLEVYYDKLAIFSKTACQLWLIDPDPLKTQYVQTLRQAGTIAHRSALQYGSGDVLYVAPDGIRSLRARNASLAAAVSDVGSPLDPVMQELFRTMGEGWMSQIVSILQPVTGRFWVILPDRIYVLSSFPGPKITAWSEYRPTDEAGNLLNITAAVMHRQKLVIRDDNNQVFALGGGIDLGNTFDACPCEIAFPFHAGGANLSATAKRFKGIDATCTGEWDVFWALDPASPNAEDYLGKLTGSTFMQGKFPVDGTSTHMSLRLRSAYPGPASLSNLVVHYDLAENE